MPNRARDWFSQALRDLEQAEDSRRAGRHEWACFAAQQAAEKAVKSLHLHLKEEAWGHVIAKLLRELPEAVVVPPDLVEKARVLDNFYIPSRYPNSHPQGAPFEHYGVLQSEELFAMPVRSLSSSVLKWPNGEVITQALRRWLEKNVLPRGDVLRVGYFGSYARGDWGVGSDLDVIMIVEKADQPIERRSAKWDTSEIPVPVDLLVYTEGEWASLDKRGRFYRTVTREVVWVWKIENRESEIGNLKC